jgi:colanic acid biosynthesis glycosyl transferase WcaI
MRLLILSQYYKPEPVPKPNELAESMMTRGHQVSVLTGYPNYPSGKLYDGYRLKPAERSIVDGVPLVRAFEYPDHGTGLLRRMLNYVTFMISAPAASVLAPRCDVIYVWHPPLTVGVAAALIARMRRVAFVYDVQDIWPESAVLSGMLQPGPLVRLMSRLELIVYRQAAHILVTTDGAKENLISKGVPENKVSVMPHWIDERVFTPVGEETRAVVRTREGWDGRFVVMFAGNLGLVQGLDTVIDAAATLPESGNTLIVIVGDGTDRERLQARTQAMGLGDRVQFIGRQPAATMPDFFSAADALLVHLKKSDLSRLVIPTKTLAYLAAGRPIIMAMEGAAADLVTRAGAGIAVPPDDVMKLVEGIETLRQMSEAERAGMGARGIAHLTAHFTRQVVIPQYEALLQRFARTDRA